MGAIGQYTVKVCPSIPDRVFTPAPSWLRHDAPQRAKHPCLYDAMTFMPEG